MRRAVTRLGRTWQILFLSGFKASPTTMTAALILSVASAVLSVTYTIGYRVLVDAIAARHDGGVILGVALVAVLYSVSWGLTIVSSLLNYFVGDDCNLYLSSRIARLTNELPGLEYFERTEYVEQLDLLQQNRLGLARGPRQTLSVLQVVVRTATIIAILASVDPELAAIPLLAFFPFVGDDLGARLQERTNKRVAERRRLANDLFTLASTPAQASELRSFGLRDEIAERHHGLHHHLRRQVIRTAVVASLLSALGWLIYGAGFATAITVIALRAVHGHASYGDVVLTVGLIRRAQSQVSQASSSVGQLVATSRATTYLVWLEDHVRRAERPTSPEAIPDRLRRGITLTHVSFTYPGTSASVLEDVSLFLPAGSSVAIVGENGAGKTTLIKLLTGMYPPTAGNVEIDDVDLAGVDIAQWRQRTTAAFQDFVKFQLLVGQTVGVGDLPAIDDTAAVRQALERAHATDLIEAIPDGLLATLGWSMAGGRDLSGGQWQKLALGRAMMRNDPLLLVLDEPTASLDAPTESALFDRYIGASRRTAETTGAVTILVSHRFSTVRAADLIVVLDNGRITETGDHVTLMRQGGLYAELFELQARSYR